MENKNVESKIEERLLPWSEPKIQKLTINLDTNAKPLALQSSIDLADEG